MKKEVEISPYDYRMIYARSIIDEFTTAIDGITISADFPEIIEEILKCKGAIICTGMGKAGIAMRKFSSTLCSFGIPSSYIHPGEASHGDLGMITPNDILFVASTSGKTREILEIIDLARAIHVKKIIGITSHIDSPIRKRADLILDMGYIVEAGHLHLAPTSSILILLALTDCVALTVAKEKGVTVEEYSLRHHSGYLGAKAREEARKSSRKSS